VEVVPSKRSVIGGESVKSCFSYFVDMSVFSWLLSFVHELIDRSPDSFDES